jgi:general secretion pathway protein M
MSRARARVIALAILVLLIGLLVRFAVMPALVVYQADRERIENLRFQLERYQQLASRMDDLEAELETLRLGNPLAGMVLSQSSESIAAASLQSKVKSLVETVGGRVTSSRVLPSAPAGSFRRIAVNVQAQLSNDGLQQVVHEIEASTPILLVDRLSVTSRVRQRRRSARSASSRATQQPDQDTITVQIYISGFQRPNSESPVTTPPSS